MPPRETVEINGTAFSITPFDPFTGLKIAGDLQKKFIAPMLSVLDGKEAGNEQAVTAAFAAGLERVLSGMDGDTLVSTAKRLISPDNVLVDWDGDRRKLEHGLIPVVLDLSGLVELCIEIARINFAPLFSRLVSRIGGGLNTQATQSLAGSLAGYPKN